MSFDGASPEVITNQGSLSDTSLCREFKQPTPFLRTREFLWQVGHLVSPHVCNSPSQSLCQEGHTAHATEEEATNLVRSALDLYSCVQPDCKHEAILPDS